MKDQLAKDLAIIMKVASKIEESINTKENN